MPSTRGRIDIRVVERERPKPIIGVLAESPAQWRDWVNQQFEEGFFQHATMNSLAHRVVLEEVEYRYLSDIEPDRIRGTRLSSVITLPGALDSWARRCPHGIDMIVKPTMF